MLVPGRPDRLEWLVRMMRPFRPRKRGV